MKRLNMKCVCVAILVSLGLSAFAAISRTTVKTVTWTLPSDWEESAEFGYPTEPVGAPSLKFIPVSIAVAEGSVCSNCTVEATWESVKDAKRPDVIQEPFIVGEKPVVTPEDPQYFGLARYPATPETIGGIENCAGEASIRAWVTPYRWNGQAGILEKATSLKLTFTYVAPRATLKLKTSSTDAYTGVMYIISPPNFVNLWQVYVDYRTTTHPDVEFHIVNTQTEIYDVATYDGHDDALRIHKYLEARYAEAKTAGRKMYAILGAGCAKGNESYNRATMIPLRMTAAANTYYYPGDLYYSCMDKVDNKGEVWDYDSDHIYLGYKKSGGGYASDAAWKVDWMPDIAAFRFPVRTSAYLQNVSSSASKTYTAEQQINGLVSKLKIYEGAEDKSRSFGGHFKYSVSYHKLFEDMYCGSTDEKIAGERSFFDGIENMWTASHNATIEDSEMITRYLNYAYATTGRPVAGAVNNTQVPNNDVEITTHSSHGQEQTAAPFQAYDFFANSRIQFFMNTGTSCLTGKIDTGDVDGHGNLCFAEACILNPNGGAIVTLNNIREGWGAYPGYNETLSLVMQAGLINGFYRLGDSTAYEAFIKGHKYAIDRVGNPSGTMAGCYVESNMMGDPLAKLSPINDTGTFVSPVGGWFLKGATATNSVNFTGTSGSVNLTVTPATANEEVTLSGSQYKVTGGVTVNNGATLKWNAPGGFGRNGITFSGSRGKIVCEGTNSRYFGTRFSGIDEILVTGYNTTFDFDKTGATRDVTALKFIGSDTNGIAKCNYIRSREGGIFSPSMAIPVVNGTLVLQTTNIGGGGNASDTTTPMFTLTNAVLKIAENPHWANEMLNRPVWMNGATISVAYQSFGFGAKVSGSKGMTLRVFDKTTNTVSGNYDAEINGPFMVDVLTNAVLKINVPLTKSSYTGSLVKTGEGQLELRAANTFAGGISVNGGTVVCGKEALTSSACGEVTVASNATLKIETLPLASVTKLTVKQGGKLILPGDITTASYQLVDPMVGSLNFEEGALVYNEHDLTKTLKGSTTSDGYYMDTSSFLHWQDKDGTWINGTAGDGTKWLKGGTEEVDFANGNSVMFNNSTNASTRNVAVSGSIQPGYITFNNTKTAYNFTNATSGAKISLENLYTIGDTSFAPEVSAGSKVVVTSGKATYNNLTTASLAVAPEGKLQLTGTLTPATYISAVKVDVTAYRGEYNFVLGGNRYRGFQFNGIQFCLDGKVLAIPAGTTISVSGSFNGSSSSGTATVQGVNESGTILGYTGAQVVANILDGSASTGWGGSDPGDGSLLTAKPTCSVTINFGSPIRMFTSYKLAGGNTDARSPYSWKITVTESTSGSSYTKSTTANTVANSWYDVNDVSYDGSSSASVDVSDGGTLFLNGTYNAPITVGENATLAVTNANCLYIATNKTFSMNGSVTLDVNEAGKYGWTEILHGANLATTSLAKFVLNSDDAAAKIESGNLYVATQGVKKGPYTNTFADDNWNWDADTWSGNGTAFGCIWSKAITRMADDATVTINNSSTGTLDCAVSCNTIFFTNTTDNVQTVRIDGSGTVNCNALDFSGLKGEITWSPDLNGANVIAGTNRVILLKGNGGTISAASNAYVSTVGKFTTYDIANETRIHFANTSRALTMADLPNNGVLSFAGMTLDCGTAGAFQRPNITYFSEEGDSLTLNGVSGNNARMTSSFDIRGGSVTVNPSGSWWFGVNGVTKYEQTGGTFTCNATGTTVGNSGSGMVLGYDGESSFALELNIAGGNFLIPNGIVNIWNPSVINLFTNGVLKTKGIGARSGVTGTVNINEESTLEVGSSALSTSGMTYNLYGGILAAFENATVSAPITLGSAGTLAAKENTTLEMAGAISADSATLNFGKAGYDGTVKLETIPTGVTNITVTAGTWDMGEYRPTNDVPVSVLNGKIAALLTDDELRQAAEGGFKLIRTTLTDSAAVQDHVAVVTSGGVAVTAMGRIENGYLYISVNYVYPLYGEVKNEGGQRWEDIDWHDAIGMPFHGEWGDVSEAVLSNALDGVTVVVTNDFTTSLKVVNSGKVKVKGEQSIATLDDGASTGETTLDLAANNVTAGAETVIKHAGTGTLTLAANKCAAFYDIEWPSANISGFSGTAKIKYVGDGTLASAPYNTSGGGYVSYAQKMAMDNLAFENSLTRFFEDGADITVTRFVTGNQKNTSGQTFYQTGGRIEATGTGSVGDSTATSTSPILFSHWPNNVTYHLTGGELIATNGADGSVYFGRDGVPKLYIGGGEKKATMRVNGFVNDGRSGGSKSGSPVELKPNGYLEIGKYGFLLNQSAELRMSGGTFLAYESAEIKSATSSFTLTANTTSYLVATNGATLTVSKIPTGTGALVCQADDGTVLLSGDYSGVTLGGKFTLKMTEAQSSSVVDVALFKVADADNLNVTVQKSDGTESKGAYRVVDGVFRWNASGNYALPLKATVTKGGAWKDLDWYDSSATPRKVSDTFWETSSSATVCELTVENDAAITSGDAITAGTVTIAGAGLLTIPSTLTISTLKGDATVIADGYSPTWGGLTANTWTGCVKLTGTFPKGQNIGALGNANSTIEFAGTNAEPTEGYFATPVEVNAPFVLSGTMKISNGNSNSIQVKFNKKFSGTGTFLTVDNSKPGNPDIFQVLGDASEFAGTVTLVGSAHSITFGAHNYGYGGYIYVTDNNGATIAADKTWTAANAINVDANGVLNIAHRSNVATPSTVNVAAGGYINLLQASSVQTVWPITSGALNMNGGVMVNGVSIGKDRYTVANGTITLGSNAVGATVSINVIGGNKNLTGKSIALANYAGIIPVKGANWNQTVTKSDGSAVSESKSNLLEVLADGSTINGPMKATFTAKCAYVAKDSSPSGGDAEMMYGYLDDGQTSGDYGATITVENIPYTTYDVYVYMGTDQKDSGKKFAPVTVVGGNKTVKYPSTNIGWGDALSARGTVTLCETNNYLKFTGISGRTLTVKGYENSITDARCGIAGIQIFNTGTRVNELTWKGAASGGTWDKTTANWKVKDEGEGEQWKEISDGLNIAKFTSDTALTLGEAVCPDVLNMTYSGTVTYEGYIPKGKDNAVLVASNEELSKVTAVAGVMSGGWITEGSATAYYPTRTDSQYSVQFQKLNNQLKCAKVVMFQDGSDIKAYIEYSGYVESGTEGNVDFDNTTYKSADTPMDSTSNGYGIKNLALTIARGVVLTVADAEKFGKAFVITNGTLCVAAGTLTQDVTLAAGTKINVISTEITNEYVVTSGKVKVEGEQWWDYILFNGEAIDSASWNVDDLANGKLKRIVKPGTTPFTYTITAGGLPGGQGLTALPWTNLAWVASNWFYVRPEEWTTNTVAEAKLTVDGGVTNTLFANADMTITTLNVANSGYLTITNGQVEVEGGGGQWKEFLLNVTTLDDSGSSGTTILGFAPTNVTAGADTIIGSSILGTLKVNGGGKATINGTAASYDIKSGGEVRYVGDAEITTAFTTTEGAIASYRRATLAIVGSQYWKLKSYNGDVVTATGSGYINPIEVTSGELVLTNTANASALLYGGKDVTGKNHSNISVTGGKLTVLASGTTGTDSGKCGFLLGQTAKGDTVSSVAISGGEMNVAGLFTCWERSTVTIANGILRAKGFYKQAGGDSSLTINDGGVFEFGSSGVKKTSEKSVSVTMNGGTLRAVDDAEEALPIALTGVNTFSAADGKTLTVSGALSGAGSVAIGEAGYAGTVVLSNATAITGNVAVEQGTLAMPTNTIAANIVIGANGKLNLVGLPGTSAPTEYVITTGMISFGEGASITNNITVNGVALKADDKWEIEGGKIKRRIITQPFTFYITQNANWDELEWRDATGLVLRDYEVAYYKTQKPAITLDVQNESSLFITNVLDLASLAVTGQKVTLDFSQTDGAVLAAQAKFLKPSTNIFIKTTSAITGNYATTQPNLPAKYTGEFVSDDTGLSYVITAERMGHDYVATIDSEALYAGVTFSAITWDDGCTFTNDYQNTVTLKLDGYGKVNLDQNLELYTFTIANVGEDSPYVQITAANDFATTVEKVRQFDFGGASSIDTAYDFGDKIIQMPAYYVQLSSNYSGPLKDGYAFCGSNNQISGSAFDGVRASMSESGTLTGNFAITQGGKVYIGGSYDGPDATFDIGAGELYLSYGSTTIGTVTGDDGNGKLTISGGTLTANLSGFTGTVSIGGEEDYQAGALHLTGTAAGNVNVLTNGTLYLTRTTPHQTEFAVTTGTLDWKNGAKLYVDDELIASNRISVDGGTITVQYNIPTTPFAFTISQSGTYNWSELDWVGANGIAVGKDYWETSVAAVQLTAASGITATVNVDTNLNIGAFTLTGGAKVVMDKAGSDLGTISGTGTIVCSDFWPEGNKAIGTFGADWTGNFEIAADANPKLNWDLSAYYNGTSSTFTYSGTVSAGYFNQVQFANYGALNLTGSITFDNGYSTLSSGSKPPCNYIFTALSGNGTNFFNKSGVTPIVWFKNADQFTGLLKTLSGSYRLVLGDGEMTADASYPVKGGVTIVGDTTLQADAEIVAPSGVLVTNATLIVASAGNLKDAGAMTIDGAGKVVVHDGILSNAVTIAKGGTLDLQIEFAEGVDAFQITTGTLTNNGTILVNGATIPNGWSVVGNRLVKRATLFWIAQNDNFCGWRHRKFY